MASESYGGKRDHKDRQNLEALLAKPRNIKPLADKQMRINLGPGNVKNTSVKEMVEEFKASEGGQMIMNGGSFSVPVTDYAKPKHKIKSVETLESMARDLNYMYQDLKSTDNDVKLAINPQGGATLGPNEAAKKAMREKYSKYHKLNREMAEAVVKEALERLNRPGLIIRSVVKLDEWTKCSQLYMRAGISVSGVHKKEKDFKRDEYDLQMVFADGDTLNWILVEVKNSNSYPWDSTVSPPNPSLFEGNKKKKKVGSWGQLAKSFTFISELFADIPFGKMFVRVFHM